MTGMTIYKQLTSLVFGAFLMSLLASCGGGVKSGGGETKNPMTSPSKPTIEEETVKQELGIEGRYVAVFQSMNSSLAGVSMGEAKIQVMADLIGVSVSIKDSPVTTTHSQFIYAASECPSDIHDTNNDGFIDPVEASAVLGKAIIPLDSHIDDQLEGIQDFPMSDFMGNYIYYKEGSLSKLLADLHAPDLEPMDELGKLKSSEPLTLEGKVVVVQGVAQETYVPGSIRVLDGTSDRASLAIACGKITRVMVNHDSEMINPE